MEVILKFNTEVEGDMDTYELHKHTSAMFKALWDYDQKLRSMSKYEGVELAQEYRDLLRRILIENNISHLI